MESFQIEIPYPDLCDAVIELEKEWLGGSITVETDPGIVIAAIDQGLNGSEIVDISKLLDECSPCCLLSTYIMIKAKHDFYIDVRDFSSKLRQRYDKDNGDKEFEGISEEAKDLAEKRLDCEISSSKVLMEALVLRIQKIFNIKWITNDVLRNIVSDKENLMSIYRSFVRDRLMRVDTEDDDISTDSLDRHSSEHQITPHNSQNDTNEVEGVNNDHSKKKCGEVIKILFSSESEGCGEEYRDEVKSGEEISEIELENKERRKNGLGPVSCYDWMNLPYIDTYPLK